MHLKIGQHGGNSYLAGVWSHGHINFSYCNGHLQFSGNLHFLYLCHKLTIQRPRKIRRTHAHTWVWLWYNHEFAEKISFLLFSCDSSSRSPPVHLSVRPYPTCVFRYILMFATLQHGNVVMLQPCNIATLHHCTIATLQLSYIATLQLCNFSTLQFCNIATL